MFSLILFRKIDLDTDRKPIKKLISILNTNQLFLAIIVYILIGITIYLITKK